MHPGGCEIFKITLLLLTKPLCVCKTQFMKTVAGPSGSDEKISNCHKKYILI